MLTLRSLVALALLPAIASAQLLFGSANSTALPISAPPGIWLAHPTGPAGFAASSGMRLIAQ